MCVQYHEGLAEMPFPVSPFTMFPSIGLNEQIGTLTDIYRAGVKSYAAGFSGRRWGNREPWWEWSEGREDVEFSEGTHQRGGLVPYISRASRWRIALVIAGQGGNAGNTR